MEFRKKLYLAPMEAVTCLPFRLLCRRNGADIVVSEMTNAKAIIHAAKRIPGKLAVCREERPVGIQIAASDPESASKAAAMIGQNADFIDINMGCPSHTITSVGCGSALLSKPEKIASIVRAVVNKVDVPVTAKIRADNAVRNAKIIEENGADAITVHARTIAQKGSGNINYKILEEVKDAVKIPIIGNGGIKNAEDAKKILQICDSAMIGTAAMGNPEIFNQIKARIKKHNFKPRPRQELFFDMCKLAESNGFNNFKWLKFMAPEFINGLEGAAKLRRQISGVKSKEQLLELFNLIKT